MQSKRMSGVVDYEQIFSFVFFIYIFFSFTHINYKDIDNDEDI